MRISVARASSRFNSLSKFMAPRCTASGMRMEQPHGRRKPPIRVAGHHFGAQMSAPFTVGETGSEPLPSDSYYGFFLSVLRLCRVALRFSSRNISGSRLAPESSPSKNSSDFKQLPVGCRCVPAFPAGRHVVCHYKVQFSLREGFRGGLAYSNTITIRGKGRTNACRKRVASRTADQDQCASPGYRSTRPALSFPISEGPSWGEPGHRGPP